MKSLNKNMIWVFAIVAATFFIGCNQVNTTNCAKPASCTAPAKSKQKNNNSDNCCACTCYQNYCSDKQCCCGYTEDCCCQPPAPKKPKTSKSQ